MREPQDRISCNSYRAAGTKVNRRTESAVTRIQPLELKSAVGRSQPQFVSSRRNSSQPWDGVSLNSYPAIRTRASRRMELAVTCIQPPELELTAGWNQPQLVFSRVSEIDISVGILDFNKYNYVYLFAFDNFWLETVNFSWIQMNWLNLLIYQKEKITDLNFHTNTSFATFWIYV